MRKLFVLFCVLPLLHLQGQIDTIAPEFTEIDFNDGELEHFRWPAMRMEYDTLEVMTFDFVIDTMSFQIPASKIVVREYTEVGKVGDSVTWNLTNADTAIVHDWTGIRFEESVWVPFDSGLYKLDTLWDLEDPSVWYAVDTALGRDVYTDYFLHGTGDDIFQVNGWLEHFAKTHPYYNFNLSYFDGKEWVRLVTRKGVDSLEKEFLLKKPKGISWFSIYLSGKQDSALAPDIYLIVELLE